MLWAMMPKASVYKNRGFTAWKNHIRLAGKTVFDSIAKPFAPNPFSNRQLQTCVPPFYTGHAITPLLFAQCVRHKKIVKSVGGFSQAGFLRKFFKAVFWKNLWKNPVKARGKAAFIETGAESGKFKIKNQRA